jgi:hypothetical protein
MARVRVDADLVEALRAVEEPAEHGATEAYIDGVIAAWNGHSNNFCDGVESDIIDAKSPDKIFSTIGVSRGPYVGFFTAMGR